MHQLFAAFFAMVFSFSHAQTVRHSQAFIASEHPTVAVFHVGTPTRTELAQQEFAKISSYAETACVSCRRMNVVSSVR
ncbi:MAG TPA: hypothetical protein VM865_07020 [Acidobacteriaceae bacterium]|jgi:hypothetical protein|nr:hypothetical protein [Acidobacteriaceae bacterium]